MSAPLSSSWRTPAIPVSGANPAASSASEPFEHLRVRVEEQQPGRVAGRGGQVARVGEAAVLARDRPGLREVALDQLARGAGGAVVHDDEVERQPLRVLEQRREAARQPALLVVRDDDDREIVHGADGSVSPWARFGATWTSGRRRGRAASSAGRPRGCCAAVASFEAAPVGEGHATKAARARRAPPRARARPGAPAAAAPRLRRARARRAG